MRTVYDVCGSRADTTHVPAAAPAIVHDPTADELEVNNTSAVPLVTVEPLSATAGIPIVSEPAPATAPLAPWAYEPVAAGAAGLVAGLYPMDAAE